jgi:hypothetical protein
MSRARRPRDRIMRTEGQKKNLREEANGNNEQFSNTKIQRRGCSLSVINQAKEERNQI